MRLPKIPNGSVATKTTLLVLVCVTAIMLTAGIWQMQHVRSIVSAETHRQASRSMENAIKIIDNRISNVETAVKTAAAYANTFAPHENLCYTLLKQLIDANEDIAAVTLMYSADYFTKYGRYFAPTIVRDPVSGKLEEDEIGGPENDFCYLETDSNWIYTNKLDAGYWCLPYIDSMSTKRAMVSYSVPIHDEKGETYAILCADIDLRWVQHIVEEAKPYDYSKVFVIGRDSQYVCHPDQRWIQSVNVITKTRQAKDFEELRLAQRMLRWERGCDTMDAHTLTNLAAREGKPSIVYFAPVERVQWSVCFTIPEDIIMKGPNQLSTNMLILLIVMLVLIAFTLYAIIHRQLKPLTVLAVKTREIAHGNFHVHLPAVNTNDEIRHLRDAFDNMQQSLDSYVSELKATTASKASMENELKVASEIQMSMLPKTYPPYPDRTDIDLYGQLLPAKAVGGDLFDFFINEGKLFFCIGDVSGKGVPASLLMAVTRSQFRTVSAHESTPDKIVSFISDAMSEGNDTNMFVTLLVGVLDLSTGMLRYSNAGHEAPLLISGSDDRLGMLPVDSNIPAGVMSGWTFTCQEALIDRQTTIFLYTDGLTEAEDMQHNQFGEDRILEAARQVQNAHSQQPRDIVNAMTQAVRQFVGKAEQSDDLTMLAIRYRS